MSRPDALRFLDSLPAEQVEKLVSREVCVHCEKFIRKHSYLKMYVHLDGFSFCSDDCGPVATPAAKVSTPATEATTFALKYVHEQRLPAWVVEHIANAYSFGQMEEIKRGRAE